MKIIIVGDIHGDFQVINHLVRTERPDLILQVGDFGYWPRLHGWPPRDPALELGDTKLYWCDGNHEDHQSLASLAKFGCDFLSSVEVAPNCFYQPRGSVLTLPDGRNVLFFGGADSSDKDSREEGEDWFAGELPEQADLEKLNTDLQIDIIISHTCPKKFNLRETPPEGYSAGPWLAKSADPTRELLDHVLKLYAPAKWYYGHFHIHQIGQYGKTEWQALAIPLDEGEPWWVELS